MRIKVLLFILLCCIAAAGFAQSVLDLVPRMDLEQFETLHEAEAVTVVDVRGRPDFASGHIPGAILIPLDLLGGYLVELNEYPQPIVTYCS